MFTSLTNAELDALTAKLVSAVHATTKLALYALEQDGASCPAYKTAARISDEIFDVHYEAIVLWSDRTGTGIAA